MLVNAPNSDCFANDIFVPEYRFCYGRNIFLKESGAIGEHDRIASVFIFCGDHENIFIVLVGRKQIVPQHGCKDICVINWLFDEIQGEEIAKA